LLVGTELEIASDVSVLVEKRIWFEIEGGECSLIASFLVHAVFFAPLPESGGEESS
jgi:hypothetical protein